MCSFWCFLNVTLSINVLNVKFDKHTKERHILKGTCTDKTWLTTHLPRSDSRSYIYRYYFFVFYFFIILDVLKVMYQLTPVCVVKVMVSMLIQNPVIAKDVKIWTYFYYVRCPGMNSMSSVNELAPNRWNSVPCTIRTFRQRTCNQRLVVFNSWDLEPVDLLNGLALGCCQPSP